MSSQELGKSIRDEKFDKEKIAQTNLVDLENYVDDLRHFLPTPLCSINTTRLILETNDAFERVTGFPSDEVIAERFTKIFSNYQQAKELIKEADEEGQVINREATLLTKDDRKIIALISIMKRKDELGEDIGFFIAFNDITMLKEMEFEYKNKIEELEKLNKFMVDREHKMIELKNQVHRLEEELGK